ncbi:MAG: lipopolysaccharide biosynthesis protein [Bacteroidaceae bacterium]|nr:lipopolysaccharide biosynthesis protein [Bacteroidaceae bacterium]
MAQSKMASLAKDTAIYGISSIVGRFLNYLLVPVHTKFISPQSGGYGIVSNMYAWAALIFVLLTFGMETTYFRFSNKTEENSDMVYSTALRLVGGVSLLFIALVFCFLGPISDYLGYSNHPEYVGCFAVIGGLDAFQAIMFSRLRQQHRPVKFMALKMAFIIPNVILNVAVFALLPRLFGAIPSLQGLYERFDYGVGLIFFVNLLCTGLITLGFLKELKGITFGFDARLARRMLSYAWPILLLGLVGILNQVFDKIAYPQLVPGHEGKVQLGIYGACVKIAMILSLLTQAFRYAYEPFVFGGAKDRNSDETLAQGMKYFIIFGLLAFLAVVLYMPVFRYLVTNHDYWVGLKVVPIVMMAELFMGIYFNLSFWYKLIDQTWWGAVMSAAGAAVMILINVAFVPRYGYMACAWGGFAGYGICMVMSYLIGQKKKPIPYPMKEIFKYCCIAAVIYFASTDLAPMLPVWASLLLNTVLLGIYVAYLLKKDLPLASLPVVGRYFRKK